MVIAPAAAMAAAALRATARGRERSRDRSRWAQHLCRHRGLPALLRIPINEDGSAATPIIVAENLTALDGVALDESGNIFVSEVLRNEIVLFSADGASRIVVATADTAPLVNPTSLVYRHGVLCTANLGWHVVPDPRTVVCVSGSSIRPRPLAEIPAQRAARRGACSSSREDSRAYDDCPRGTGRPGRIGEEAGNQAKSRHPQRKTRREPSAGCPVGRGSAARPLAGASARPT